MNSLRSLIHPVATMRLPGVLLTFLCALSACSDTDDAEGSVDSGVQTDSGSIQGDGTDGDGDGDGDGDVDVGDGDATGDGDGDGPLDAGSDAAEPTDSGSDAAAALDASADAGADGGDGGDGGDAPDPELPATFSVMLATVDRVSGEGAVDVYDFGPGGPSRHLYTSFQDGDVTLSASNGLFAALQHGKDALAIYEAQEGAEKDPFKAALDLRPENDQDTWLNPADAAYIAESATILVPLYNVPEIAVVDAAKGELSSTIDLSEFNAASDPDGSPDVGRALYLPSQGLAYFVLQRIDLKNYDFACNDRPALLIAVDGETLEVVDLNGAASGKAIELELANPYDMLFDQANNRLLVRSAGCDDEEGKAKHGVEAVNLTTLETSVVYHSDKPGEFLTQIQPLGSNRYLISGWGDNAPFSHSFFDGATGERSEYIEGAPSVLVLPLTSDTLLYADTDPTDGWVMRRYRLSTGDVEDVVSAEATTPSAEDRFSNVSSLIRLK